MKYLVSVVYHTPVQKKRRNLFPGFAMAGYRTGRAALERVHPIDAIEWNGCYWIVMDCPSSSEWSLEALHGRFGIFMPSL